MNTCLVQWEKYQVGLEGALHWLLCTSLHRGLRAVFRDITLCHHLHREPAWAVANSSCVRSAKSFTPDVNDKTRPTPALLPSLIEHIARNHVVPRPLEVSGCVPSQRTGVFVDTFVYLAIFGLSLWKHTSYSWKDASRGLPPPTLPLRCNNSSCCQLDRRRQHRNNPTLEKTMTSYARNDNRSTSPTRRDETRRVRYRPGTRPTFIQHPRNPINLRTTTFSKQQAVLKETYFDSRVSVSTRTFSECLVFFPIFPNCQSHFGHQLHHPVHLVLVVAGTIRVATITTVDS